MKIRPSSLRYVASRDSVADFRRQLAALATQTGIYQDENTMDTPRSRRHRRWRPAWIWNLADEHFPGATEIVDFMHAKTHLYDVAKHAFGEEDQESVENLGQYHRDTPLQRRDVSSRRTHTGFGKTKPNDSRCPRKTGRLFFKNMPSVCNIETFNEKGYQIGQWGY